MIVPTSAKVGIARSVKSVNRLPNPADREIGGFFHAHSVKSVHEKKLHFPSTKLRPGASAARVACCEPSTSIGPLTEKVPPMSDAKRGFSSIGFAKTFVLPGLLVFMVPVASLLFFLHAQSRFDAQAREEILSEIRQDASLAPGEREQAIAYFTEHPFSELIQNDEFAADVDSRARFDYATFRWMIRLSALSIAVGISVFLLAGLCVLLSLWSQRVQYLSLSASWQVLRLYGALQTAVQGLLLLALSFWVTALWFQMYSVKLVLVAAVLAIIAVCIVIAAIFKRSDTTHIIEGKVLDKTSALPLWKELNAICAKIGT